MCRLEATDDIGQIPARWENSLHHKSYRSLIFHVKEGISDAFWLEVECRGKLSKIWFAVEG